MQVGVECSRCGGQLLPDTQDTDAKSCLQCGAVVYAEPPADFEPDRRSRTDNRQTPVDFADEYRKGMTKEAFDEAFEDLQDLMEDR